MEYRKNPGLVFVHFCIAGIGLGGQAGDGVAASPRERSWSAAQGPGEA